MKKIVWLTIACVLLFSNQALAHTGLESSTPAQGSTVTEQLSEITLTFLTKIEETSSFTVTNSSDESVEVSGINVEENVMNGSLEDSLDNGAYKINWKIIGADGHPMEGVIDFVLEAPQEAEVVEEVEPITEPIEEVEPIASNTEEMETTVDAEDEKSSNSIIGIIIVLVIILALAVWWITRRNKK